MNLRHTLIRNLLSIGLALAPLSASGGEPDDTLSTASTTGLIGLGQVTITDGELGDGKWVDRDVDLYSFEVDVATTLPVLVTIEVTSLAPDLDSHLRLFDGAGTELANNDDRAFDSSDPMLATYLLNAGIYYAGVSSATNPHYDSTSTGSSRPGAGGMYSLTITTEAATIPQSAFEPNDAIAGSPAIANGSFTAIGEFIGDGDHNRLDVDIYRLHLIKAARIDVTVRAASIGSLLDPVLRIRTCADGLRHPTLFDDCLLVGSDATLDGTLDVVATAGVLATQDVYITVSGAGNRRYDPSEAGSGEVGSVGVYDLDVTVTYFDVAAPDEPNDSTRMATRLAVFATGRPTVIDVEGFLGDGRFAPFQGDRDFYEVTLVDDSQWLSVEVTPSSGSPLDPVVTVYDVSGNRLVQNDNTGASLAASVVVPVSCVPVQADAKSVYVAVWGAGQRPPTDPSVPSPDATTVEPGMIGDGPGSTGAYRMTLAVSPVVDPCANEPDDVVDSATATGIIDEGIFICTNGEIGDGECESPSRDVDLWSVEVAGDSAFLRVSAARCRPNALTCISLYVFDMSLELIGQAADPGNERTVSLGVHLEQPGTYFVGVVGSASMEEFDPTDACRSGGDCTGSYDLMIQLERAPNGPGSVAAEHSDPKPDPIPRLFATLLNRDSNEIALLDPNTAEVVNSYPAPEPLIGGSEGLAVDGVNLFYLGVGFFPRLYRLDPATGTVLDETILWTGSGFYSDAVLLSGELYLLDYRARSIHVIDPLIPRWVRTLDVGRMNGITLSGGLAALADPNRLYITDAFNSRAIYEIDPSSGLRTRTLTIPPELNRPTALAGVGSSVLYVGDWQTNTLARLRRDGAGLTALPLDFPVGSLAGEASTAFELDGACCFRVGVCLDDLKQGICTLIEGIYQGDGTTCSQGCVFGDLDRDGDTDLIDVSGFFRCFTGTDDGPIVPECLEGDFDHDTDIDRWDARWFMSAVDGP